MNKLGFRSFLAAALLLLPLLLARAQTNSAPDFKEVYDLLRAHLSGVTEAELNRAAVKGLTSALGPKVSLVPNSSAATDHSESALVTRSNLFDGKVAYVRIARVD